MLSDLDETGTTVLEMVKSQCGANLVSDQKVEVSQKFVHHLKREIKFDRT